MTQDMGSGPKKQTESSAAEEQQSGEHRDHTVPPDKLDPVEQQELPEGAQPPRPVARRSWFAAALTISLVWIAATCIIALLIPKQNVAFYVVYLIAVLAVAAMPILYSWRLRVKELKDLNDD